MTICIGLETRDGVVLAADSAVTHGGTVRQAKSSLGEHSDTERGTEEGALKIIPLGAHAAAAIAGNAHDASEAIAWFEPYVQSDTFEKTWAAAMSARPGLDFALLLARWHRGSPELYVCVGDHAERARAGRPQIIGSVRDDERTVIETRTRLLLVRGNKPRMIQLGMCALLVWRALNEAPFSNSIGGAPASLWVGEKGSEWMPDTSIYAVDVRPGADGVQHFHDQIHRVSIVGREEVVAVASTHTNETRLLVNPRNVERLAEWERKWLSTVLEVVRQNNVRLVALVGLVQRRLAVLELDLCQGKYILVTPDEVKFGQELKDFFLGPPPKLPGGALYSIPLGEPAAIAMIDSGGPRDDYDLDLAISYLLTASDIDEKYVDSFRVWESLIARFPIHAGVLSAGVIATERDPDASHLGRVLDAWENALLTEPALTELARFVMTKHPDNAEIARRLNAMIATIESRKSRQTEG